MIYSFFMAKDKLNERMNKKYAITSIPIPIMITDHPLEHCRMSEIVSMVTKQPLPENKTELTFEICVNRLEDDEEVDVPFVKYRFRPSL
jgi:hypothetical protein